MRLSILNPTKIKKDILPLTLASILLLTFSAMRCSDKSTNNPIPKAPSDLLAYARSTSSILLYWADNSDNETSFIIYRSEGLDWEQVAVSQSNDVSFLDSLLQDTTAYTYTVKARNSHGDSPPSDPVSATTYCIGSLPLEPVIPYPPDSSIDRASDERLYWQCSDSDGDALVYDIYFGTEYDPLLVDTNLTNPEFFPGLVQYSTTYHWKIVAKELNRPHHKKTGPIWNYTTHAEMEPFELFDHFEGNSLNDIWIQQAGVDSNYYIGSSRLNVTNTFGGDIVGQWRFVIFSTNFPASNDFNLSATFSFDRDDYKYLSFTLANRNHSPVIGFVLWDPPRNLVGSFGPCGESYLEDVQDPTSMEIYRQADSIFVAWGGDIHYRCRCLDTLAYINLEFADWISDSSGFNTMSIDSIYGQAIIY